MSWDWNEETIRQERETGTRKLNLRRKIFIETGLEVRFNVARQRWYMMKPEFVEEDIDSMFMGDCKMSREEEQEELFKQLHFDRPDLWEIEVRK